ncbi:hypothetical protein EVAR_100088_1 [Eumeta japonica]|uniref:Uncharacterized protein n=1 Tax=Eumeta variegata TaxID=151549 RepID=A0A4C1YUP1_EUMVA|nr:hypothetical protein EVAR_100088_1 [Eumeta japonica]
MRSKRVFSPTRPAIAVAAYFSRCVRYLTANYCKRELEANRCKSNGRNLQKESVECQWAGRITRRTDNCRGRKVLEEDHAGGRIVGPSPLLTIWFATSLVEPTTVGED